MNVNFYLSNLNSVARNKAFEDIKQKINNSNIVILTPDRNTMNIETAILQYLNRESIFNLNVTTFTRLAKNYLIDNKLYKNVLTKHASIALIKKIMIDIKDNLKVFKKNIEQEGFCEKIFETICLYKSCKILPENFYTTTSDDLLAYKLQDLYLIYTEYEKYFKNDFTDSFNQLDLFEKCITKDTYADTEFYLVDFEDITPAIARVVAKLAKCSKSLTISTTTSKGIKDINNSHIYINDIYQSLADILDTEGVRYNKIIVEEEGKKNYLSKNIFGGKYVENTKANLLNMKIIKANNIEDEIKYITAEIKKNALDKIYSYNDVGFVVSNMDTYRDVLKKYFEKCDIPYYFDESESLDKNILCQIVSLIIELMTKGVDKYPLLKLIDSGIFKFSLNQIQQYKGYVTRIDAKGEYLYNIPNKIKANDDLQYVCNNIKEFVERLKIDSGSVSYYKDKIYNCLQSLDYDNYYNMLYTKYVDNKDIVNAKKVTQSYTKLNEMWNELEMVMLDRHLKKTDFYSIFKTFVSDIKLNLPPISVNSLVVCDFGSSYIEKKDIIYFVGASDGELPKYTSETALLSDNELGRIEKHNRITPTINIINKRKKFKLYEMILKANQNIVFSYVCVDNKGEELYPSIACSELEKYLLNVTKIDASDYVIVKDSDEQIITNNITKKLALDNIVNYIKQWDIFGDNKYFSRNVTSVYHAIGNSKIDIIGNNSYINIAKKIKNANKLYFKTTKASPSQFESFARCPYAHFMNYGLKLKEQEVAKASTNDIGNIIHDYLKLIIIDLNNYKNDDQFFADLKNYTKLCLDKVLKNANYARFVAGDLNINLIKSLYEEAYRMTIAILEQLKNSDYEPEVTEFNFGENKTSIALQLKNGKQISVTGKVDRVDCNKLDNTFIIIDYKTGNSKFDNFTEFIAGNKIQLFVYMLLYRQYSKKMPVGAFYLPINNKLEKTRKYRYQGFFVNNPEIIGNIDHVLKEPSSIGISLRLSKTKDNKFSNTNVIKNLAISNFDINNLQDYLKNLLNEEAEKIEDGVVDIYPLYIANSSVCKFCKYKGICNFNRKYSNRYRKVNNVENLSQIFSNKNKSKEENNV